MAVVTDIRDYSDERGNQIIGVPKSCTNSRIDFRARNCRVEIGEGATFENSTIRMTANGGLVRIGRSSVIKSVMRVGRNSSIIVGERLSSTGGGSWSAAEETSITIGDDCMFAVSLDIRSDHGHPIFDRRTGQRLNKSKSIVIGDHVWLSPRVFVYPGACIGEGSVIGARSLVNHAIPPNCIAIGVPARVTRRNIVWDKRNIATQRPQRLESLDEIPHPWESTWPIEPEPTFWTRCKARLPFI